MALHLSRRRARGPQPPEGAGPLRVDARTKDLTKRLRPGDIAVIDHADLDRVSAEALVGCQPLAVVNASPSISGRYPNLGPQILLDAGVPLIDCAGRQIMDELREGQTARVHEGQLWIGDALVAQGTVMTPELLAHATHDARIGMSEQLEAFAANTMEYMRRERDLLFDGVGVPDIATELKGRHALIVVRGYHYKEDLQALRHYIREYRPVLIGVDGGADALVQAGHTPDLIVGDMDSVSDATLTCGAEIVVHAYRDGRAPGRQRVLDLGVDPVVFPATGTSEDVAMLLADDKGAQLIVAVGTHATLVEFLDKGRAGMASTFLTRLRVGSKLVDAKGVSRLYRSRLSTQAVLLMLCFGLVALFAALWTTPGGQTLLQLIGARWDDLWSAVAGVFT